MVLAKAATIGTTSMRRPTSLLLEIPLLEGGVCDHSKPKDSVK